MNGEHVFLVVALTAGGAVLTLAEPRLTLLASLLRHAGCFVRSFSRSVEQLLRGTVAR